MKPERIQEELDVRDRAPEIVLDFLDRHPAWHLAGEDRLVRDYRFTSTAAAGAFARYATQVAGELDRAFSLELRGRELRLVLGGESTPGDADSVVELAAAISGEV